MFSRSLPCGLILLVLGSLGFPANLPAQAQAPAGNASVQLTPEQAAAAWDAAAAQIAQIEKRIQEIQQSFQSAPPEQQNTLRTEALSLIEKIKEQFRELGRVSPQAYPAKALPAGTQDNPPLQLVRQALGLAYTENRYADASQIAAAILKVDPKDQIAVNIAGVSEFAQNHFAEAVAILERAEKEMLLIPDLGGHYLESARSYVQYWDAEQKIRAAEEAAPPEAQNPRVLLKTTRGDVLLELFENNAPNTVANFISLVEKGYYDGSPFHRVIPNFMAQGGTPGTKFQGASGPGYTIECECYRPDARRHFAGTLSMAHAGKDTGGSQFFLTHLPTPHLDREINPESVHTVFGRVVDGMNVVEAIQQGDSIVSATVVRKRNHPYVPQTHPDAK